MSFGIPVRNGLGVGLLASTSLSTRGGSFSPASLFLAGEQGFIYDPSDLSTMFQDTAGTTPVTAVGQTVGLVLDKSRGLVLGPELVTNGDFSNGTTGWLGYNYQGHTFNISSISDQLVVQNDPINGGNAVAYQPVTTVIGKTYTVVVQYISGTPASPKVQIRNTISAPTIAEATISGAGVYKVIFTATATTTLIILGMNTISPSSTTTWDNISVRELPGNHATQSVLASRPILQQDANGKFFLLFDGSDDFLVTNTITPGTDKAQVFAGVRKLSDTLRGAVLGLSSAPNASNGALELFAPGLDAEASYGIASRGTSNASARGTTFTAPITNAITSLSDISGDSLILRVNGTQVAASATDQGTGNYLAYPAYIGRRGGTALPFNGRIYSLIVRFGANLTAAQIAQTEAWVNSRTGAY